MSHTHTTIAASTPVPSTCHDSADARDASVVITIDGRAYRGAVTLLRDHTGELATWGDLQHWASDGVIDALAAAGDLRDDLIAEIVYAVRQAQQEAIPPYPPGLSAESAHYACQMSDRDARLTRIIDACEAHDTLEARELAAEAADLLNGEDGDDA